MSPLDRCARLLHWCGALAGPRYYEELKDRSIARFSLAVVIAVVLCAILYTSTAVAGYLAFGDATMGDVFKNFPDNYLPALLARLFLAFNVITTYPLVRSGAPRHLAHFVVVAHARRVNGLRYCGVLFVVCARWLFLNCCSHVSSGLPLPPHVGHEVPAVPHAVQHARSHCRHTAVHRSVRRHRHRGAEHPNNIGACWQTSRTAPCFVPESSLTPYVPPRKRCVGTAVVGVISFHVKLLRWR